MENIVSRYLGAGTVERLRRRGVAANVSNRLKTAGLLRPQEEPTMYNLVRALGTQARMKYAESRKILAGIEALRDLHLGE